MERVSTETVPTRPRHRWSLLGFVLTLSLLLGACSVVVEPEQGSSRDARFDDVITQFAPTRGAGSDYFVGEDVYFRFSAGRDGYLTLVSIDPDGRADVLVRNAFVRGRASYTIPNPNGATVFTLVPPRGQQEVRAIYTSQPTDASVVYRRNARFNTYDEIIVSDIETSQGSVRDVARTFFFIR